jgi:tetratricopeptide (TPR) repeat protein
MPLRHVRPVLVLAGLFLAFVPSHAQTAQPAAQTPSVQSEKPDPDRQRAIELYNAGNFVEAMPLFEKLAADYPEDSTIKASWAFSISAYAATLKDPELRKKARVRARSIALQARNQGNNSATVQIVLQIPEDGSEPAFSDRKDVDDAMKSAEADFVRGDFEKARTGYLHALLLDPKNYVAALYIGDVYYKQHVNGSAGEWFAHAIQIDPNRETAYRYWGDALLAMGNISEAREKYISAVIAEPYNRMPWSGLGQWAQRSKTRLNLIHLQDQSTVTQKDDTHINVTLDPGSGKADPASAGWTAYGMERASWRMEKFKKEFPSEAHYRRTMREEADALHVMVGLLSRPENAGKLDPSLDQLVKIDQAGLLEPFVFFNRPDKEIAQDYAGYREAHRDLLLRYFNEFVLPSGS